MKPGTVTPSEREDAEPTDAPPDIMLVVGVMLVGNSAPPDNADVMLTCIGAANDAVAEAGAVAPKASNPPTELLVDRTGLKGLDTGGWGANISKLLPTQALRHRQ